MTNSGCLKRSRRVNDNKKEIKLSKSKKKAYFKIVAKKDKKILYLLENEKKLFETLPSEAINLYDKVAVISKAGLQGVFNSAGDFIGWFEKVIVENGFIKVAKSEFTGDETGFYKVYKWGLYTVSGKKFFEQNYINIGCKEVDILGTKKTVLYATNYESGKCALFDSERRLILPWDMISIEITGNELILTKNEGKILYHFELDPKDNLILVQ